MERIPERSAKGLLPVPEVDEKYPRTSSRIVGIAGTAKNTGKTTTLNCLLQEAFRQGKSPGVTGIGYDGEELDTVTFLPKPRITVYPGFIVTTSEQCLANTTAKVTILQRTGIWTPLGEIIILCVEREGNIVVAGPNTAATLRRILAMMRANLGTGRSMFVDGSLNRIAPMAAVDSVIFTTGGSRSTDIAVLCDEMRAIESFFRLPVAERALLTMTQTITIPALYEIKDVDDLLKNIPNKIPSLVISRYISLAAMERLNKLLEVEIDRVDHLILPDPFVLMMSAPIERMASAVSALQKMPMTISVAHLPVLSLITANPFIPHYTGTTYVSQFLKIDELMSQLRSACTTPIVDTKHAAPETLLNYCGL